VNVIEKDYTPRTPVLTLIVHLRLLLGQPNFDDPIDADRREAAADKEQYYRLAGDSAKTIARSSVEEWLEFLNNP
jgi:ubiquitin-protein ligase